MLVCYITGEFSDAIPYMIEHKVCIGYMLVYAITSIFGVFCVFAVVVKFGALINSILTTTRKFLSILFSIYLFGHKCSLIQYCAIFITFTAIIYNLYTEHSSEKKSSKEITNTKVN